MRPVPFEIAGKPMLMRVRPAGRAFCKIRHIRLRYSCCRSAGYPPALHQLQDRNLLTLRRMLDHKAVPSSRYRRGTAEKSQDIFRGRLQYLPSRVVRDRPPPPHRRTLQYRRASPRAMDDASFHLAGVPLRWRFKSVQAVQRARPKGGVVDMPVV